MEEKSTRISEIVSEIQNGDNTNFEELYNLTSKRAYYIALEFLKNEHDAEDILQDSYVKALSKINTLDKPESFQSWLNQIVANKSRDLLKKKKPTLFNDDESDFTDFIPDERVSFNPEKSADREELRRTVMEVLDELGEDKKACIMMMYFEENSIEQISQCLEIPEGTVKARLFHARKDMKELFRKRGVTSLYSAAPLGAVIWAIIETSKIVEKTFEGSAAAGKVLEGITVVSAGSVAAATTGTTAAASGTAVATSGGIVAKISAMTAAQKIVAGVATAAVIAGATAGTTTVVKKVKEAKGTPAIVTENETTSSLQENDIEANTLTDAALVNINVVNESGKTIDSFTKKIKTGEIYTYQNAFSDALEKGHIAYGGVSGAGTGEKGAVAGKTYNFIVSV